MKYIWICLFAIMMGNAMAHPPSPNVRDGGNLWQIEAYYDNASDHSSTGTQQICFSPYTVNGTQIQGEWYSTTFSNWSGRYRQEGDQVFMYGNYNGDTGHDSITFSIVSNSPQNLGAGHWFEWSDDGSYGASSVFVNAVLTRIGGCASPSGNDSPVVAPRLKNDGSAATYPLERGQVPLNTK